jgi:tetratricopeptide (TPR) repeat protein
MRQRCLALWLALSVLGASLPAAAQQPPVQEGDLERAKASFKAGAKAYAAGDYLAAIQALDAAYAVSPLPAIAFSLAQAERKQYFVDQRREHLDRAIALFRQYLDQEPRGARREDASLAIAQLETLLGAGAGPKASASLPQQRPTRLMIQSNAPGAIISLDGGQATPSPLIREVTPGKHRALVRAQGFQPAERDVTAVQGELLLTEIELSELPASLFVWAPARSDIVVDGVYVGQGGALVTVPVSAGPHQLTVLRKGCRVVRRDLRVERGQSHSEVVALERTTQRQLSELLFIGGGAALGASLVWSAFAVRAQNDAEDFLRRLGSDPGRPADRIGYDASIVERNRFRTAATVSVAGSVGMFITGLFLHELDRPTVSAGPPREPARKESASLPRFQLTPQASSADLGASLQMSF